MTFALLLAAAAALLLWPSKKQDSAPSGLSKLSAPTASVSESPSLAKTPTFRVAVDSLAYVRGRLVATESLDEPQKTAIDTLMLALTAGSDK